jgi:hypothetical protein
VSSLHRTWTGGATSSTWDDPGPGLLLHISVDEDAKPQETFRYVVRDFTGLRHGAGNTLADAVADWANYVEFILTEVDEKLGPALRREVARYRKALGRESGTS